MASFGIVELHRSIAEGIRQALVQGGGFELRDAAIAVARDGYAEVVYHDERARQIALTERCAVLVEQLERQTKLASTAKSERLREHYERHAEGTAAALAAAEEAIHEDRDLGPPPDRLVVHGRTLLDALDRLASSNLYVSDKREHAAIRSVLMNLRFDVDDTTARWSVDVALPTTAGLAVLRGVTGSLPRKDRAYRDPKLTARIHRAVVDHIIDGADVQTLMRVPAELNRRATRNGMRDALLFGGLTAAQARFVGGHPLAVARQVATAEALGRPIPSGLDSRWVEAVVSTAATMHEGGVLNPLTRERMTRLTDVLSFIADAGDDGRARDELKKQFGSRPIALERALGDMASATLGDLTMGDACMRVARQDGDRFVFLPCPQCGVSDPIMVWLPELRGLVCLGCFTVGSIRIPSEYADWLSETPLFVEADKDDSGLPYPPRPDGAFSIPELACAAVTCGVVPNRHRIAWAREAVDDMLKAGDVEYVGQRLVTLNRGERMYLPTRDGYPDGHALNRIPPEALAAEHGAERTKGPATAT